ncbi:hypothetical protein EX895_002769 [Sporisorium graminicola]|uniref:Uncharacterized protein n=1 Tax=Sporisorium graminicola TaxID=280036 RepID=A0A4U7KW76_9BASI|nr:hypothetical protein EX895_002769 [Sporisorium graminicola]TKY88417.1 hypothetical protein EX895_002769 [Sporisorium graminicola]
MMSDSNIMPTAITTDEVACIDCQPDPAHPSPATATATITTIPTEDSREKEQHIEEVEDLTNPSTFVPPLSSVDGLPTPLVVIEYCQRCKFGLRANWFQQELLSTFAPSPPNLEATGTTASVASVMLIPKVDDISSGRFRIYIATAQTAKEAKQGKGGLKLLWDRKVESGFPEMRILKQKVRDLINPDFGLGHSDKK